VETALPPVTRKKAIHKSASDCGFVCSKGEFKMETIAEIKQTSATEYFRFIPEAQASPRGNCEACGLHIRSEGGIRVQGVGGVFCNVECVETTLFGRQRCRWCGSKMEKVYTSLDSRLCSEDCSANYYAHVTGDHTAALGSGVRFSGWLQKNRPQIYRVLLGQSSETGFCQNASCKNGDSGGPASLANLRSGARFCSESCKKQDSRHFKAA
jgi:hypothetical protein